MTKRLIILIMTISLFFTGCDSSVNSKPRERPHLYWKNVDAIVTKVDKTTWFSVTRHYKIEVTVEIEEYGLTKKFAIEDAGVFNRPEEWELKKGDVVEVTLYSWKMDSTGEVVKREIHCIN